MFFLFIILFSYLTSSSLLILKVSLYRYDEGLISCITGLAIDVDNSQIKAFKLKCETEIKLIEFKKQEAMKKKQINEEKWKTAWEISYGGVIDKYGKRLDHLSEEQLHESFLKGEQIKSIVMGYASDQQPPQFKEILPHIVTVSDDIEETKVVWPMLILYPQYGQFDIIQGVGYDDMLVMHLAEMFPVIDDVEIEKNTNNHKQKNPVVPWDRDGEYQVSKLVVYIKLHASKKIQSLEEWMLACREQSALRGEMNENNPELNEKALEMFRKRAENHEKNLENDKCSNKLFNRIGYLDVHLGCTIKDILHTPDYVLAGGLITLIVYVKGNKAHKKFLSDVEKSGNGIWILHPAGNQSGDRIL